jgi:putative acyl-CoA dehydrogenase
VVVEALECHGGNGFIENHLMARLYREAPLNGIWEGTGNVICLDVVRAIQREPATIDAFVTELRKAKGEPALDRAAAELEVLLKELPASEGMARHVIEKMAYAFQASLLLRHAPSEVADAFCASRLGTEWRGHFGSLRESRGAQQIIDRARVAA